jgi:hypothetical protein
MGNDDEQGAGGGQRVQANQAPGVSADMIALVNMLQHQQVAQDNHWGQQHANDQKAQKDAMAALKAQSTDVIKTLGDEVKRLAILKPKLASPLSIKLTTMDFEKDRETFKQWEDRWNINLRANLINLIVDPDERQ